jgi:adenylate kinase family enzyme
MWAAPTMLKGSKVAEDEDVAKSSTSDGSDGPRNAPPVEHPMTDPTPRSPESTLAGCDRIVVVGRTGSGKTTLARELAAALEVPHVELDSLYFGPKFTTVPPLLLRERTNAAIAGDRWVVDGNKRAVRQLVWARADTIIWLDYSLVVSLRRLGRRAFRRVLALQKQAAEVGESKELPRQLLSGARAVFRALRSHIGQRHEFPMMLEMPENRHLAVARLRSPKATRRWTTQVVEGRTDQP